MLIKNGNITGLEDSCQQTISDITLIAEYRGVDTDASKPLLIALGILQTAYEGRININDAAQRTEELIREYLKF